jgi:large subunit ribosomal protein L7/L12
MSDEEKKAPTSRSEHRESESRPESVGKETPTVKPEESKEEVKAEAVPAETKAEPSGKFADLVKQIEELSVADLAELVKVLEDRFGVSASAPIMVAGGVAAGAGAGAAEAEEKSNYTVVLAACGDQKINVIKALREINQNLGLKEAKDIADAPPKEILKDAPKAEAEEAKKKLEAAGATVEMK